MASEMNDMQKKLQKELEDVQAEINVLNKKAAAIVALLEVYAPGVSTPTITGPSSSMTTMNMARVVIRNAGRPLKPEAIRDGIQKTFGIRPAKTLNDMLWKRARNDESDFYKNDDGEIGLTELQPKVTTVRHEHFGNLDLAGDKA